MVPEILHHIEQLQVELAAVGSSGDAQVVAAVAEIAAQLRDSTMDGARSAYYAPEIM